VRALRFLAGLVAAVLATVGFGAVGFPAPPDFFLIPVADLARTGAPIPTMLAALAAGLIEDLFLVPGRLLGLHAFSKVLIGYLLATIGARMVVEKPVGVGGLLAGAVLVESAILVLLLWVLRGDPIAPQPVQLLMRAAATGLLGAGIHAASRVPWRARFLARRRRRLL
jgi:rod shape-determining protein MreD